MTKNNKLNFRLKTTLILLMILLTSVYMNPLTNFSSDSLSSETKNENNVDDISNPTNNPKISTVQFDDWWNKSFAYRALINVTNLESVNVTNTWASIQFNYADLVSAGKMNASLKDVRIIEIIGTVPTEREYYIHKDFPSANLATVYFRTNCENNTLEMDTYMYYGNNTVDFGSNLVNYNPIGINWYRFEEGSGTTVSNELGQYDGTMVEMDNSNWESTTGADEYQIGDYYLDYAGGGSGGRNEYIYIQDQVFTGAESIPNLTVSCWFKTSFSHASDEFANWAFFDFDRSEFFNFFINAEDGRIGFATASTYRDMQDFWSTTSDLNDGNWHFAMAMFNMTHKVLYVDGVAIDAEEASPHYTAGEYRALGRADSGDQYRYGFMGDGSEADTENGARNNKYYEGGLDEVRYFNGSLDYNERLQVYKQYELITALNEEHANTANFKVTAIGLDGEYIPNAIITLNETSDGSSYIKRQITGEDGTTTFTGLATTPVYYNFTVNITSTVEPTLNVRVNVSAPILFTEFYIDNLEIICNVSTVEFDINDVDGKPVESGWVLVGNETGIGQIQNCSIDEDGKTRFWWLDDVVYGYKYNYTVWYHQPGYYGGDFDLNRIALATNSFSPNSDTTLNIKTNLTTVNFDVRELLSQSDPIEGVILELYENITTTSLRLVAELTTDDQGNATLRWVNSSTQIGIPFARNYTLRIWFWGYLNQWKISAIKDVLGTEINFEVAKTINYTVLLSADPDDFQMELLSLNPDDTLFIEWGTQVSIRYMLNITTFNGNPTSGTIPADADSMTYIAKFGTVSITGALNVEVVGSGRHIAELDTSQLEIIGSQTTYTVTVTAEEAGFQSVQNTELSITVIKNDAYINETDNDESVKSNFWLEDIDLAVQPYGENSETLLLEYELFTEESNNYKRFDLDFFIPEIATEWNLSHVIFDIHNVTHGTLDNIELNITDPSTKIWTWNNNSVGNYYFYSPSADNGTWNNLMVTLNKKSLTLDNSFVFTIEGTFSGPIDIIATAYFLRNEIETSYTLFNITDNINLPSDRNGWVIKNIEFDLYNCRNPSDWSLIDPSSVIEKLQTNEGINFTFSSHSSGAGRITIDNITIYPLDDQFLFNLIESGNIMFDVNITIKYIQGFYWNPHLSNVSAIFTIPNYVSGDIIIDNNNDDFSNIENILQVSDINDGGNTYSPLDVMMNITYLGQTYTIGELGAISLSGLSINNLLGAYIQTSLPVNFTLTFLGNNFRLVNYKISGDITFEATPTYKGSVSYDDNLDTYLLTLDTSLLNAQLYTIVFTYSSNYYDDSIKNLNVEVLERETLINNRRGAYQLIKSIYVQTTIIFSFIYTDEDYKLNITSLDEQRYEWEYYGEGSSIISFGEGQLAVNSENQYILDFNTRQLAVGSYQLIATLSKQNYETKIGIISLIINKREVDYSLGDMFEDKQASVVKGETITLEIKLEDETSGQKLTGADVVLEIGDKEFDFDEEDDGVYELEFSTKDYEAFFTSNTLTATIKISKSNYTTKEVDIVIVVEMEEVTEGVPTFYFIMVVAAIAAVVGSLATYRYIQIAQIPTFVKKARKVKKSIKAGDKVSEALLYPSKEAFMVKTLEEKYKALGLSLEDLLGLKGKTEDSMKKDGGVK